jgi:hypothetical protein
MSRIYLLSGWDHLVQVGHTVLFMTAFESGTLSLNDAEEAGFMTSFCPCARHEGKFGSGSVTPLILNVRTRWRWLVRFTPRPLAPAKGRFQFGRSWIYLAYDFMWF